MPRFVPDHLKTKAMYKNAVRKFPFVMRSVADQCNTKKWVKKLLLTMVECQDVFLTAKAIKKCVIISCITFFSRLPPDTKNAQSSKCSKHVQAVGTYPYAMQFVVEYYMYQEICNKTVYTCSIEYDSVLDQYMAQ